MRTIPYLSVAFLWFLPFALHAGEAVKISTGEAITNVRQPQLAIAADGDVHLVFGAEHDVYYACSTDGGKSFSPPTRVGKVGKLALGMRRGPRIAVAKDTIIVTAIGGELGGGRDGDLWAWRSLDDGKTWSEPIQVNDEQRSAREGLHAMAASATGELVCVWLDLRNKGTELWGATSADHGQTWSANFLVYRSPDGSICECCHPSVVYDAKGNLHVLWRNSLKGNRDLYLTHSRDGGKSFAPAVKLGEHSWELDACPMDGGMLAINAQGNAATIWRRDKQIISTLNESQRERPLGPGMQPWIAANGEGSYRIWLLKRPGDLLLLKPNAAGPEKLAANATDPVIAANPTKGTPVVAAWESEEAGQTVIYAKVIVPPKAKESR